MGLSESAFKRFLRGTCILSNQSMNVLRCVILFSVITATLAANNIPCAQPAAADAHPCGTCTANNGQEGYDTCVWCYATKTCSAISITNPTPCGDNTDFTLGSQNCDCRPDEYTDCGTCVSHPGCVWVSQGENKVTLSGTVFGVTKSTTVAISVN